MRLRRSTKIALSLSPAILAGALVISPFQVSESDFINFTLPEIKQEKITKLVVDESLRETAKKYQADTQDIEKIGRVALTFKTEEDAANFAKEAQTAGSANKVEKDVEVKAFEFNDPYYGSQTNLSQMYMADGWNYLSDAASVKIAIVDTGVRGTHEDLTGRVAAGYNVLTSSAITAGTDSDNNNHGTAMASAAAASANNSAGLVGTAYNAWIMPVKALNSSGTGDASDVATGVIWAVDNGAGVINLSLGSSEYSQTLHDSIQYAANHKVPVVVAAGNDGGALAFPARDSLSISVGSVNSSGVRSSFSNTGSELDVVAPGEGIYVAIDDSNSAYGQSTGTSVSAAQVSGIVALEKAWHWGVSVDTLRSYITQTTTKLAGMNGSFPTDAYGYGLVNYARIQTVGDFRHSFVTQNGYPTLAKGSAYNFSVSVKNQGSTTWRQDVVHLATARERDHISPFTREGNGPSGWSSANRVKMQQSSVAPGETATFSFWMRNDGVGVGTYREYFQLVADGVSWMEDYGIYWDINVPQPTPEYAHAFVTQNSYPTLDRGASNNFTVSVRNTGSQTWSQDVVHLGTSRSKDRISRFVREGNGPSGWSSANRVKMQQSSVAPGETATFSFWMRNDGVGVGTYREYFQLVADGVSWMEDYGIYWDINVPQPTPDYAHSFVSQSGYPTLAHGESNLFVVTVKNTGTRTWSQDVVHLGTSRDKDRVPSFAREGNGPSGWSSANRVKMDQASVAPGENATFSFWMRNDSTPSGTHREHFQLVADGVSWMEDYGIYWDVRVP